MIQSPQMNVNAPHLKQNLCQSSAMIIFCSPAMLGGLNFILTSTGNHLLRGINGFPAFWALGMNWWFKSRHIHYF
jgi:hypothetical protein